MRFIITRSGLIILLLLALIGLFALWFLYTSDIWAGDIRNILLISIDTCRADRLSCYGYKFKTTPNIDALAAEGTLFENVITPIPQTLPAHASMLTGTIPPYHRVHDNSGCLADKSNISLAEILKDAGFTTAAAVSALVLDSQLGLDQGFDTYHDHFETPLEGNAVEQRSGGETTDVALHWLEENKDKRFFFFLHYFDPHRKYEPPEPFASRFAGNLYAGEIAYTDHCIGQVLDKLKELGLYDSTLIIITSDHGEMLGEHGEFTHVYFIYQSVIKVPLIFKVPGRNKPARIKSLVGLIDIVPTICSLLDIEVPKNVQGLDLSSSLKGKNTPVQNRHLVCESLEPTKYDANSLLGILNDRYKYIQTTRPEMYDLITDPTESNNLLEQQPQRARIMKDRLAHILEQSVRQPSPDDTTAVDPQTIQRLGSLGYVGVGVNEDFSFDQTMDDPKDLLDYHHLSVQLTVCSRLKEYDNVEMLVERMVRLRPDISLAYEQLGSIALQRKDYPKAVVCFEKAIEIDPGKAGAYNRRGAAHLAGANYDQALRDFDKAIDLNPNYAEAHINRGLLHRSKGQYDQAIRDLDQAIQLNPKLADAYNHRAAAYLGKGEYDRALNDCDQAIELNPRLADAYNNQGLVYLYKGEHSRAVSDFDKAIELNPKHAKAYLNRGVAYLHKGEHNLAVSDFDQAIELNPEHAEAYTNRGLAYSSKGHYDRAIHDFNRVIELNPSNGGAHVNMALALLRQGNAKEAISHYRQALRLRPNWPEVMNELAWILATHADPQIRNGPDAVRLAERACELTQYKLPTLLDTLAAAYAELGQFAEAVKTAEKAIKLAQAAGQKKLAEDIQGRLELYKAKRPYREFVSLKDPGTVHPPEEH